jgi:hypothetical protein
MNVCERFAIAKRPIPDVLDAIFDGNVAALLTTESRILYDSDRKVVVERWDDKGIVLVLTTVVITVFVVIIFPEIISLPDTKTLFILI